MSAGFIAQATQANDRGMLLMHQCEYGKAARCFIEAFANSKNAIAGKKEEELLRGPELAFAASFRSTTAEGEEQREKGPLSGSGQTSAPSHLVDNNQGGGIERTTEREEDYSSFIFSAPMSTHALHPADETKFAVGISVIAIYNFGLLCLLAPSSPSRDSESDCCKVMRQRKKGKFLKAAVNLLELAAGLAQSSRVQISLLFEMALANNLGQAHRIVGDDYRADQSFRYLLSAVLLLHDHAERRTNNGPDQLIIPEEFFRSFSHLLLSNVGAPAA